MSAEQSAQARAETADVTWVPFDGGHTTGPAQGELIEWLRGCF